MIGSKEALDYQQMRRKRSGEATQNFAQQNNDSDDDDDDDEDIGNYDMVVPSGDFNNVKETPHPIDLSKSCVVVYIQSCLCPSCRLGRGMF